MYFYELQQSIKYREKHSNHLQENHRAHQKVVSLILIATSTTYIAWHIDEIIDVLSQSAQNGRPYNHHVVRHRKDLLVNKKYSLGRSLVIERIASMT